MAHTTAQLLGAYRRELEAEGIPAEVVTTLVIEAARAELREGPLIVSGEHTNRY